MDVLDLMNRDKFAANAGCKITELDEQHAVAEMTVMPEHLNGGGVCQGGALFTLADLAIAALVNSGGRLTFGISNNIVFVSSANVGDLLRAEAVWVADHHKIPSAEARVTNQEGRLICHVTGMGYRKATLKNI
jgi:acyl-CoA thioesterase